MVDGNGLENRRGETHREFESRPLRQVMYVKTPFLWSFIYFPLEKTYPLRHNCMQSSCPINAAGDAPTALFTKEEGTPCSLFGRLS